MKLTERLRAKHDDTWPQQIGYGDLYNEDGPAAAERIEQLETALREISDLIPKATPNYSARVYEIAQRALGKTA